MVGCATWAEADVSWSVDDEGPVAEPGIAFGYGGEPIAPPGFETRDVEVATQPGDVDDTAVPPAAVGSARRRAGPVCRLPIVTATVRPRLSPADIHATIRRHENDIRACYNRALRTDRTLEGRIVMRFVIVGDGTVGAARVESTQIEDAPLHACMVAAVQGWTFPAPPGSGVSVVNYPYVFSAT